MEAVEPPVLFPWIPMAFICLGMLAHSVVFTSPLPYVAFMVVDFGEAKNLDEAGYSAGWITGMFMIGRTIAGIPWGLASDRWGRKVCLILSMVNVAIFGLFFGFSTNFTMALLMRFCIGLGNGYMAVAKTAVTEIVSTKEHEVRAFGYLNGCWGLGMVIGPSIGGFLARPSVQYPNMFSPDGIWGHYPYLLPCICCSLLAALAAIGMFFFFQETLQPKNLSSLPTIEKSIEMNALRGSHNTAKSVQYAPLTTNEDIDNDDDEKDKHRLAFTIVAEEDEEDDDNNEKDEENQSSHLMITTTSNTNTNTTHTAANNKEEEIPAEFSQPTSCFDILANPKLLFLIVIYGSSSFVIMFVEESFPLWAVSQLAHGGFDWDSQEVGETLALIGSGLVLYQFVCFEYIMKTFFAFSNPVMKFAFFLMLTAVMIMLLPVIITITLRCLLWSVDNDIHRLHTHNNVILSTVTIISLLLYFIFATGASTTFSMIVNASVNQQMRGTMNGLQMTSGSIGNGLGPILGSMLYAYALERMYGSDSNSSGEDKDGMVLGSYWPFDGRIVFIIGGILMLLMAIFSKLYMTV